MSLSIVPLIMTPPSIIDPHKRSMWSYLNPFDYPTTEKVETYKDFLNEILPSIKDTNESVTIVNNLIISISEIVKKIAAVSHWFESWKIHVYDGTITLLKWVYDFLSGIILQTPFWLFSNEWFINMAFMFGFLSFCMTILFGVIDAIKRIMNKPYTNWKSIAKGMPFVILGSGFFPLIFQHSFSFLNKLTSQITLIGKSQMLNNIAQIDKINLGTIDALALFGFDIVLVGILVPVLLQMARRWFDIISLGALTPIALSCSLFDDHRGYFETWKSSLTKLSLFQLYYAIFITFIGLLIFGVNTTTFASLLVKLLLVVGGLWRMAYPPNIVKSKLDTGADIQKVMKETKDALTLKHLRERNWDIFNEKPKKSDDNNGNNNDSNGGGKMKKVFKIAVGGFKNLFKK